MTEFLDAGARLFICLIVCTMIIVVPLLLVDGGWWVPSLPPMVVREWKPPEPSPYVQLTSAQGNNIWPVWSPDNWHLAFASNRFGNWSVWTMCEDGTKQRQLTANNTISRYPAWSPDGSRIAYLASVKGQWDIWVMYADGTGKTKLMNGPIFEAAPQWSPDGKLILFTKQQPRWNIWVTCGDGVYQAQLTKEGDNLYPSWSADGKKIVFSSKRSGSWDIWIMNADGTNQTQLTTNPEDEIKPRISPDGQQIAYMSKRSHEVFPAHAGVVNPQGDWSIWKMKVDGTLQTELISFVKEDCDVSWSPDGKRIMFIHNYYSWVGAATINFGAYINIYTLDAFGMDFTPITRVESNDLYPQWSPDGTKIACASDRSGRFDIWLIRLGAITPQIPVY